jgi:hypothetical protein
MAKPRNVIMPIAAALGALSSTAPATEANAKALQSPSGSQATAPTPQTGEPNTFVSTGKDLLGFTVTEQADGTVVAQHASHASHASHHSHYSGR